MAEHYEVRWSHTAKKALSKFDRPIRQRLFTAAQLLGTDPYPSTAKHLVNTDDLFRVRVGDYRIVYSVEDNLLVVLIVLIGHRKEIYRHLNRI